MGRTVIVAHSHPAFSRGGGELAAYRAFAHLRGQGADAAFVGLMISPDQSGRFFSPGQRVMRLGEGDYVIGGPGMDSFEMEHQDPAVEDWLFDFLDEFDGDTYHFHHIWNIGAGTIRRLAQARPQAQLILTLHDYTSICANHGQMVTCGSGTLCNAASTIDCAGCFPQRQPIEFVIRRARMLETLAVFDLLISPSEFLATRFEAWGVPPGRISVLENGLPQWPAAAVPETLEDIDAKSRRFSFFGSASPTKGLDVLARAASILARSNGEAAPVTINVYGVTAEMFAGHWPDLEIPPNLIFGGPYEPAQAVPLMRQTGWLIIPSVWWENAPVVIQEARAAGVPVIASNIGGMAEKVADFGLTFPVGDPAELARLLAELAGNTTRLLEHRRQILPPLTTQGYTEQLEILQRARPQFDTGIEPSAKAG